QYGDENSKIVSIKNRIEKLWLLEGHLWKNSPEIALWMFEHSHPNIKLLQRVLELADYFRHQVGSKQRTDAYNLVLDWSQKLGDSGSEITALRNLAELSEERGDLKAATHYHLKLLTMLANSQNIKEHAEHLE